MAGFFKRLFGRGDKKAEHVPVENRLPAAEPQHLGSEEETFLATLVADLADGKRRDEVGNANTLKKIDGVWSSGHERLAITGKPPIGREKTARCERVPSSMPSRSQRGNGRVERSASSRLSQ